MAVSMKNQQMYLSEDLIIQEILTRLPIKSVLRFKSVSKQWYATLSSSDFANAHLLKSPFSHPNAPVNSLFIMGFENHCYLFSYNDEEIPDNYKDNLVEITEFDGLEDRLTLTGCCNGLICLSEVSSKCSKYFILWNPATRKLHKYESDGYLERFDAQTRPCVSSGFGYASSVDDYKYVRILTNDWGCPNFSIVHIFSLKENRWRKIDFGHDAVLLFRHAVLVGEKLYWAAYRTETGHLIVSFDLGVERFDVIKIDWDESDFLVNMGGCLSKCNYSQRFVGDNFIHVLEPPSIVKSIALPEGLKLDVTSKTVGFTKTDKIFVTGLFIDNQMDLNTTLGVVDTRTEPVQYTTLLRFNECVKIIRYFSSLIAPFPYAEPSEA
ncbi:F-box protein CPR1-like [Silene latifolia]|uniref:F-box protein CPR1-like n=1 Tax=Silene latifolia TaxID=37657 RepID=UPI003D771A05